MAFEWIPIIKDLNLIIKDLGNASRSKTKTKDLLIRELKLNIKSFEDAYRSRMNFDKLADLISNEEIKKARSEGFNFSNVKKGSLASENIRDERNKRYINKNSEWLFKNIDEKIEELKRLKAYHGSLENQEHLNMKLKFSNLFYKLKLLADFILN